MKVESTYELFLHNLRVAYYVEQNLISELENMREKTTDDELAALFENSIGQSADHADRLDQVFGHIDETPEMHRSRSFSGILYEIDHLNRDVEDRDILNLVYLDSAIKIKRLEISIYESLLMLTRDIEVDKDARRLLERNLNEDKEFLKSLKKLKKGSALQNILDRIGV